MSATETIRNGLLGGAASVIGGSIIVAGMRNPVEAAIAVAGVAGTTYAASSIARTTINESGSTLYSGIKFVVGANQRPGEADRSVTIMMGAMLTGTALAVATGAPLFVLAGAGVGVAAIATKAWTK